MGDIMESKISIITNIETNYKSFTKTEKIIADYVTKNFNEVYSMTLNALATDCQVGEATIMRFIKKLGFANLAEFKISVANYMMEEEKKSYSEHPFVNFQQDINELTLETLKINPIELIEKAVDYIENAEHVVFMGNGTSGYVVEVISYIFNRAGLINECITDVHFGEIRSSMLGKNDVMIAVSYFGDNIDITSAAKRARENGCKVVSMTTYKTTTLPQVADIALYSSPESMEHRRFGAGMRGIMTQEFLAELLYITYRERHKDEVFANQQKTAIATATHHEYIKGEE